MSAHGLIPAPLDVFEGVIYRQRLYPVFSNGYENWIDIDGNVLARRVTWRERPRCQVMAHLLENGWSAARRWEED